MRAQTETERPGELLWAGLVTPGAWDSVRFYTELLEWDNFGGEATQEDAALLGAGDKVIATISELRKLDIEIGGIPYWIPFFRTDDIDAAADRVVELGGNLWRPPYYSRGFRVSVVLSPAAEVFGLAERRGNEQMRGFNPAAIPWLEVVSMDVARAETFYPALFGWESMRQWLADRETVIFNYEGRRVASLIELTQDYDDHAFMAALGHASDERRFTPPHWMVYFRVDDLARAVDRAKELGARAASPDFLPTVGRFAILRDPQGAYFSLIAVSE